MITMSKCIERKKHRIDCGYTRDRFCKNTIRQLRVPFTVYRNNAPTFDLLCIEQEHRSDCETMSLRQIVGHRKYNKGFSRSFVHDQRA
jgi:hypothetical protein